MKDSTESRTDESQQGKSMWVFRGGSPFLRIDSIELGAVQSSLGHGSDEKIFFPGLVFIISPLRQLYTNRLRDG